MRRISNRGNAVQRYRQDQESKRIDTGIMSESIVSCIREARKGSNCALIVDTALDEDKAGRLLSQELRNVGIRIVSSGGGGYLLEGGVQIRVLTANTAYMANLLLGPEVKLFHALDGDARVRKARKVLSL